MTATDAGRVGQRLADTFSRPDRNRTCIVDGHGVTVSVKHGHLVVVDGVGPHRRTRRYNRATAKLNRIVMLAPTGTVTLDAQRWIERAGISYLHLAPDGTPLVTSAKLGSDNPGLRRAQALAGLDASGLDIARNLIQHKVDAQRHVLVTRLDPAPETLDTFDAAAEGIGGAGHIADLLYLEGRAAAAYWSAWSDIEIAWADRDAERVPEHWQRFGNRAGRGANNARNAINPPNAILNYLYRLLEAEARIAVLAVGLDPGLGIFHADKPSRDSLVHDVIEPARAAADHFLLDLLQRRSFARTDFTEGPTGVCRINPPVTHALVEAAPQFSKALGPHVEEVAAQCHQAARTRVRPATTPLTGSKRSVRSPAVARAQRPPRPGRARPPQLPERSCRECGAALGRRTERSYCDTCVDAASSRSVETWSRAGVAAKAKALAEGVDPRQSTEARRKRNDAIAATAQARRDWQPEQPPNPDLWANHILPGIQDIPVRQLAEATGLSTAWCSKIRRGQKVPHPAHWDAFAALLATQGGPTSSD